MISDNERRVGVPISDSLYQGGRGGGWVGLVGQLLILADLGAHISAHTSAHTSFGARILAHIKVWEHIRGLVCALFCPGTLPLQCSAVCYAAV